MEDCKAKYPGPVIVVFFLAVFVCAFVCFRLLTQEFTIWEQTTATIPVISGYTHLEISNGEIADFASTDRTKVEPCSTYVHLDGKELDVQGDWHRSEIDVAWVHPVNSPSRLDASFPLLQVAMKGTRPTLRGVLMVTTSAHASGVFQHKVCCGIDCDKAEL